MQAKPHYTPPPFTPKLSNYYSRTVRTFTPAIGKATHHCIKPASTPKLCAFYWNTALTPRCQTKWATPRWKPRCAKRVIPTLRISCRSAEILLPRASFPMTKVGT